MSSEHLDQSVIVYEYIKCKMIHLFAALSVQLEFGEIYRFRTNLHDGLPALSRPFYQCYGCVFTWYGCR